MQRLQVGILTSRALGERQCTMEGEGQYVNVEGPSVQYKKVHTRVANSFKLKIKIDQSEKTKSHMFNKLLKLTNRVRLMAKYLSKVKCC